MVSIVELDTGEAAAKLDAVAAKLGDATPLFRRIAQVLEAETERNFAAQGRPQWVPLSAATIEERRKRNKGSSILKILQDRGILAASISSDYGADYAQVGAGGAAAAYAGIHQFGGTIERPAHSTKVRLRTGRDGSLMRQGSDARSKNLAVFARDSHKQVRESWAEVGAYTVDIPARPYLPFKGSATTGVLQPETEVAVLEVVMRMLDAPLR